MDFLDPLTIIKAVGLAGVVLIVFAESGLFFGFFLPGDSLLFTAGFLASQGYFDIGILVVGCVIAAITGDSVGYAFGRAVGPKIFTREDSFFFHKKHVARTAAFFEAHGKKTIVLARFVPVVRTFAPILAGVGGMRYRTFLSYNIFGGLLWAAGFPILGYMLGHAIPSADKYILPIVGSIILASFIPVFWEMWKAKREKAGKGDPMGKNG